MDPTIVIVITTLGTEARARTMAETLVAERLAACVQIIPIESIYRWEGDLRHDVEYRIEAKTLADHVSDLVERIKALHDYVLPEVIVMAPAGASKAYADWVRSEISTVC